MEAYQRARKAGTSHLDKAENQMPPRNVLKVNVDAAVSTKDGLEGLGAVIKDSSGFWEGGSSWSQANLAQERRQFCRS